MDDGVCSEWTWQILEEQGFESSTQYCTNPMNLALFSLNAKPINPSSIPVRFGKAKSCVNKSSYSWISLLFPRRESLLWLAWELFFLFSFPAIMSDPCRGKEEWAYNLSVLFCLPIQNHSNIHTIPIKNAQAAAYHHQLMYVRYLVLSSIVHNGLLPSCYPVWNENNISPCSISILHPIWSIRTVFPTPNSSLVQSGWK